MFISKTWWLGACCAKRPTILLIFEGRRFSMATAASALVVCAASSRVQASQSINGATITLEWRAGETGRAGGAAVESLVSHT